MFRRISHTLLLCLWSVGVCVGQDESVPPDAEARQARTEEFLEYTFDVTHEYRFTAVDEPDVEFELIPEPVLHWTNPAGGTDWDGTLYLWTRAGRPEAIVSIHKAWNAEGQPCAHEFHSLSTDPFNVTRNDNPVWHPREAGVQFEVIPGAPEPAESPRFRLLEMRGLARQFRARATPRERETRELRLMPQPLYRYERSDEEVLDGSLYSFVYSTDPEVTLLIEARRYEDSFRWEYAFARQNLIVLQGFHNDREVWRVDRVRYPESLNRDAEFTLFYKQ